MPTSQPRASGQALFAARFRGARIWHSLALLASLWLLNVPNAAAQQITVRPQVDKAAITARLEKFMAELDSLKAQRRDLIPTIQGLQNQAVALHLGCSEAQARVATANAEAARSAEAAGTGAVIGGVFAGPAGAALGAAAGGLGAGGGTGPSAEDVAKLEDCRRAAQLDLEADKIKEQVAELDLRIKALIQEIEQTRKDSEPNIAAQDAAKVTGIPVATRPSKNEPAKSSTDVASGSPVRIPGPAVQQIVVRPQGSKAEATARLTKLDAELEGLRRRKQDIVQTIADLQVELVPLILECSAVEARVAAARAEAAKSAEGAGTGAVIGGVFAGPAGIVIGAAAGLGASGGGTGPSAEDLAKLEDCKRVQRLEVTIDELKGRLGEVERSIKATLNEIEDARKATEAGIGARDDAKVGGIPVTKRPVKPEPVTKLPATGVAFPAKKDSFVGSGGINTAAPPNTKRPNAMDTLGTLNTDRGLSGVAGNSGGLNDPRRVPIVVKGGANIDNAPKQQGSAPATPPPVQAQAPKPPAKTQSRPRDDLIDYGGCAKCGASKDYQPK